MKNVIAIIILVFSMNFSFAQDTCNDFPIVICNQFEENYVATNLNEAISYVECVWGKEDLEKLKSYDSQNETIQLYVRKKIFCLEQRLQFLDPSTRLSQFFFDKLIDLMPSDIENIIYTSLQRKLNGEKINLDEQLENYKEYYKYRKDEANAEYIERRNKEFSEFKVSDTIQFSIDYSHSEKPNRCNVQAFIKEIDSTEFMLKIEIVKNCVGEDFYEILSNVYSKENEIFILKSEEIINTMPNGKIIWTDSSLWKKIE